MMIGSHIDRTKPPYRIDFRNRGLYDNFYTFEEVSFHTIYELIHKFPDLPDQVSSEEPDKYDSSLLDPEDLFSGRDLSVDQLKEELWESYGRGELFFDVDRYSYQGKLVNEKKKFYFFLFAHSVCVGYNKCAYGPFDEPDHMKPDRPFSPKANPGEHSVSFDEYVLYFDKPYYYNLLLILMKEADARFAKGERVWDGGTYLPEVVITSELAQKYEVWFDERERKSLELDGISAFNIDDKNNTISRTSIKVSSSHIAFAISEDWLTRKVRRDHPKKQFSQNNARVYSLSDFLSKDLQEDLDINVYVRDERGGTVSFRELGWIWVVKWCERPSICGNPDSLELCVCTNQTACGHTFGWGGCKFTVQSQRDYYRLAAWLIVAVAFYWSFRDKNSGEEKRKKFIEEHWPSYRPAEQRLGKPAPSTVQPKEIPVSATELKSADEKQAIRELLNQLNDLVGLQTVKQDVSSLVHLLQMRKMRKDRGLPSITVSLHLVFSGNPGTGKTTVARLLAEIYHQLGVLSKGHLVETDRSGLVGGYVGQTAIKVQEVIQKSLGGILFIDEAYALASGKGDNDYGREAVDTLIKGMEDHRDDLVVIVAGYPGLMEEFLNSNPGLRSRFNKFICFPDYTPSEMVQIFESQCADGGYRLSDDCTGFVREYFEEYCRTHQKNSANGRAVRNFFEQAMVNQANRLIGASGSISNEMLVTLERSDVQGIVL